jgi:hypothetical protein
MWWRSPNVEHLNRLTTSITECVEHYRDLEQRFKVLERELDDLHSFYRRLKGQYAADAKRGNGEPSPTDRSSPLEHPETVGGIKAQLRSTFLSASARNKAGL